MPTNLTRSPQRAAQVPASIPDDNEEEAQPVAASAQQPQVGTTGGMVPQQGGEWWHAQTAPVQWSADPGERRTQSMAETDRRLQAHFQQLDPFAPSGWQAGPDARMYQYGLGQANQEYQQQAVAAREQQRDTRNATNSKTLADFESRGVQHYTDPGTGLITPIKDEQGRTLFHQTPWEQTTHPKTGLPVLGKRDQFGQRQFKDLPVVPGLDPTDEKLYYRNPLTGETTEAGAIADMAQSPNYNVAKIALAANKRRSEAVGKRDMMDALESATALGQHVNLLDKRKSLLLEQLKSTQDLRDAEMADSPKWAGYDASATQLEDQVKQLDGMIGPKGTLTQQAEQAQRDYTIASHVARLNAYKAQDAMMAARLRTEGKDPMSDGAYRSNLGMLQGVQESLNNFAPEQSAQAQGSASPAAQNNPATSPAPQITAPNPLEQSEPTNLMKRGVKSVGGVSVQQLAQRFGSGDGPVNPSTLLALDKRSKEIDDMLNAKQSLDGYIRNAIAPSDTSQMSNKLRKSLQDQKDWMDQVYTQRLARLSPEDQARVQAAVGGDSDFTRGQGFLRQVGGATLDEGNKPLIGAGGVEGELATIPRADGGATHQMQAGLLNVLGKAAAGLTSKTNLALLVGTGGAGKVVQRLISGGFGASMLRDAWKQAPQAWATFKDPKASVQEKTEAIGDLAMTVAMGGAAIKHAASGGVGAPSKAAAEAEFQRLLAEHGEAPPAAPVVPPTAAEAARATGADRVPRSAEDVAGIFERNPEVGQAAPVKSAAESARAMQDAEAELRQRAENGGLTPDEKAEFESLLKESQHAPEELAAVAQARSEVGAEQAGAALAGATPEELAARRQAVDAAGGRREGSEIPTGEQPEPTSNEQPPVPQPAANESPRAVAEVPARESQQPAPDVPAGEAVAETARGRPPVVEQSPEATAKDRREYDMLQKRMSALLKKGGSEAVGSDAYQSAWKRSEDIKNRHGGMPPETKAAEPRERIVNAALRDEKTGKISTGVTHGAAYREGEINPGQNSKNIGFMTDSGRYITQEEAAALTGGAAGSEEMAFYLKNKEVFNEYVDSLVTDGMSRKEAVKTVNEKLARRDREEAVGKSVGELTEFRRANGFDDDGNPEGSKFYKQPTGEPSNASNVESAAPVDQQPKRTQGPRKQGRQRVEPSEQGAEAAGKEEDKNSPEAGISGVVKARQSGEAAAAAEGKWQRLMRASADKVDSVASEYSPEEAKRALDRLNAAPGDNPAARKALEARAGDVAPKPRSAEQRLNDAGAELPPVSGMSREAKRAELDAAGIKTYNGKPLDEANPAEISNAVGKLRRGQLTPEGETTAAPTEPRKSDKIIKALNDLKLHKPGELGAATPLSLAHDAALDLAILGVKAGRAIADVVKIAVARFKAKYPGATDEDVSRLTDAIHEANGTPPPNSPGGLLKKASEAWRKVKDNSTLKDAVAAHRDAVENMAGTSGQEVRSEITEAIGRAEPDAKLHKTADDALRFYIESDNGNAAQLAAMRDKVEGSEKAGPKWKAAALKAIDYAVENGDKLKDAAARYRRITDSQLGLEQGASLPTMKAKNYVPRYQDVEEGGLLEPKGGGGNAGSSNRKVRSFDTMADSIAAGVDPKSLSSIDSLTNRIRTGSEAVNMKTWKQQFFDMQTPDGKPMAVKPEKVERADGTSYYEAPEGYRLKMTGGEPMAVKEEFARTFDSLTEPNWFSQHPAGLAVQEANSFAKSMMLAADTFHLGRLALRSSMINLSNGKIGPRFREGLLVSNHSPEEIMRMAQSGEIPKADAARLVQNKKILNGLQAEGFNTGRIADAIHSELTQKIPGIGKINKFIFEKFQKGAMADAGVTEFQRMKKANPDMSDQEISRTVAKELNTLFGSLGRQGLLKSATLQAMARMVALAPQWNESLIRSEAGGVKQLAQFAKDKVSGKEDAQLGIRGRNLLTTGVSLFAASQLMNLATRGKPTWENPEEGADAKMSGWIPDAIGKSAGFFFNPLGLTAETSHLLMKNFERSGNAHDATRDYLRGRESALARMADTYMTGEDPLGRKIPKDEIWEGIAKAGAPVPISAGTIGRAGNALLKRGNGEDVNTEKYPGEFQKQLMQSFGGRTDRAPTPEGRIQGLAHDYLETRGKAKDFPKVVGDYEDLTAALRRGNRDDVKDSIAALMEKHSAEDLEKYYKRWQNPIFTGSHKTEGAFLSTLSPEQREQYAKARAERRRLGSLALRAIAAIPAGKRAGPFAPVP